jgi:hypothetical protein
MTDQRDEVLPPEEEGSNSAGTGAGEAHDSGTTTAVDLQNMSSRLGSRLRHSGKSRTLKLICMLLALSPGVAIAQAATVSTQQRFERSFVGSERLGISLVPAAEAAIAGAPFAPIPAQSLRHRGPGVALMIVGAAAMVTGLLIEESLITILGAGTGLVGLYLYLR